jgi:hypothetical protein
MLLRFLLRLKSRLHTHEPARRRARPAHSSPRPAPPPRQDEAPRRAAYPAECPLCNKRCILAQPRCKHGEAFVQFMRTYHAGDPRIGAAL